MEYQVSMEVVKIIRPQTGKKVVHRFAFVSPSRNIFLNLVIADGLCSKTSLANVIFFFSALDHASRYKSLLKTTESIFVRLPIR